MSHGEVLLRVAATMMIAVASANLTAATASHLQRRAPLSLDLA